MRVYVTTYNRYNAGSLAGKWFDLSDYADRGAFFSACKEYLADETDPEIMFADIETSIPGNWLGESHIDDDCWEYLDLAEHEKETVEAYYEAYGNRTDLGELIKNALESLSTTTEGRDHEDFIDEMLEVNGYCDDKMTDLKQLGIYMDYEASWHRHFKHNYHFARYNGRNWYFRAN